MDTTINLDPMTMDQLYYSRVNCVFFGLARNFFRSLLADLNCLSIFR